MAAATGYGWGTSAHSFLRAIARRFGRAGLGTSIAVDAAAVAVGAAAYKALPASDQAPPRRASPDWPRSVMVRQEPRAWWLPLAGTSPATSRW